MLSIVRTITNDAPKSVAGISISNTHIRYIFLQKTDGTFQVVSYGEVKIPYDVVQNFRVELPVEFTETVRTLTETIPVDTNIFLKADDDVHKVESLSLAGYKKIHTVPFPDSLLAISVPYGVEVRRVMVFGQWDRAVVFLVEHRVLSKLGVIELSDSGKARVVLKDALYGSENDSVILTGVLSDEARGVLQSAVRVEDADYFQNLIDIEQQIPTIQKSEVPRFSVPLAAITYGILTGQPREEFENKEAYQEERRVQASEFFKDIKPLTKTDEDARRSSERVRGRTYKKMMSN